MPTVTEIVTIIAPISQYLAANDIANGSLYGGRINPFLSIQIYIVRKSVKFRYDAEGVAHGNTPSQLLVKASNWLFQLCDKYGMYALSLINSGGVIPAIINGGTLALKFPIIGVAGDGGPDDPIVGVNYYINAIKLKNLGSTNNWRIQAVLLKLPMDNFEPTPDFSYNPTLGAITNLPFVWEAGNTLYIDRNQ